MVGNCSVEKNYVRCIEECQAQGFAEHFIIGNKREEPVKGSEKDWSCI